ncbi:metallophosphoesterase [Sporosarcina sp. E16_3]|uniref:metallophosphoesterase family protein n=1 Tax=Sporosarcina sp. E16_3 TaxID=2789293 RepID=UPI001A911C19|nr:metallophosphoesterase [Sporosarcina sp. E16_3]MBO0600606.1 metallophosphoesterase [Sporosarcina sp. E16_3]
MTKPIFSFPVISDVHITNTDEKSHHKLEKALKDLHEVSPDYDVIIFNGDMISDGRQESYNKLKELVNNNLQKEAFFTIGNHEFFKNDGNEAAINRFLDFSDENNVFYEKSINGYPFIFLGTESWGPIGAPTKDSAVLSKEQLDWLEESLIKHAKSRCPIFVFLHQPIPYTLTGTDIRYYENCIIQSKELMDILNRFPQVFYFSGHTHWDLRMQGMFLQNNFTMANTGSVYNTWGPDEQGHETVIDPDGSQGLLVQVYEDKVVIKGRDFAKQQWLDEFVNTVNPTEQVN